MSEQKQMIIIPARFQKYLHHAVSALIESAMINDWSAFSTYLASQPHYFPEYTIHGIQHINNVLDFADKLIPDTFFYRLRDDENRKNTVSVLVLAILLHDLGMFIKPDGLLRLIGEGQPDEAKSKDAEQWKKYWQDFQVQMRHSPDAMPHEVFERLKEKDWASDPKCMELCAVFIRKYHPRIAYQIAKDGFPGTEPNRMLQSKTLNEDIVHLAGIIAMSHGTELRDPELQSELERLEYEFTKPVDIPAYYLMAVLRIADLIDAGKDRAPVILSDMSRFMSERSEKEWRLNQRIKYRQWLPEKSCLHIKAQPESSEEYVRLKEWFTYWQDELDLSWAVIGEYYGLQYTLTIRRIRDSMNREQNFVTRPMTLKANPTIGHLMIEPLYGNDSRYGVRELIQNAADACNERKVMDGTEGSITVDVDTKKGTFTITDNGIGMTEDVIADYYLTIGASFRNSPQWCKDFQDADGKPKLARSGRFGVGALAAFLIGPKVTVTTRYYKEKHGYSFTYSTADEQDKPLNVIKKQDVPVGTTVQIEMSDDVKEMFCEDKDSLLEEWTGWYYLTKPEITYRVDGEPFAIRHPLYNWEKGVDEDGWFSHDVPEFESFHFSFYKYADVFCNGIKIDDAALFVSHLPKATLSRLGYVGDMPSIAVRDPENCLQVNLARNEVISPISVPESLVREFCKYQIAVQLLLEEKIVISEQHRAIHTPFCNESLIFSK